MFVKKRLFTTAAWQLAAVLVPCGNMRSMEELMMDMFEGNEKASYHFKRVTDIICERAALCAKAGVDFIHMGDDIGMQSSIMMSEEMYREWIKPLLIPNCNKSK